MTQAAVLTGDLVGSTEAGPEAVEKAMEILQDGAESLAKYENIKPMRFTRSRGDSWQAIVDPSGKALRAVTFLLASLRRSDLGMESRIGIGIGSVTFIGKDDLSDAHGTAFVASGQALDRITGADRLFAAGPKGANLIWLNATLEMLAYLSGRWSIEQSHAIAWRTIREDKPLYDLAKRLEISRQALSSRLAVAGEKPIMAAIRAAEATL